MDNNNGIEDLLALKLAGALSKEEEERFDQLMANDPKVKAAWDELLQSGIAEELDNFNTSHFISGVKREMARRKQERAFRSINIMLVAATVTGFGLFIYMLNKPANTQKVLSAGKNIPGKSIYLQPADGSIVNLSENERGRMIKAGQVVLYNYNDTLKFSAPASETGINRLVVPAGKDYTVQLSDGSTVHLNASSTLEFPFSFSNNERDITFAGEAYLRVATEPNQPFIVHVPNRADIQVLGTDFNINSYDSGKVTVSLVQGSIKLTAGKQEAIVEPGFQAAYTIDKSINTCPFDKDDVLSWLEGKYVFHNVPLRKITPILERLYDVRIVIDDPAVAEKPFTGDIMKTNGLSSFLKRIKLTGNADNYTKDDTIHIK